MLIEWLKTLSRWFSLMVMILLTAVALLLTPTGLQVSMKVLAHFIPGELRYQQVNGTLLGPIAFKQLSYRYQDQQFIFNQLSVQWYPSELLIGKIVIAKLNADSVVINTPTAPAPSAAAPLSPAALQRNLQSIHPQLTALQLPVKLQINQANIRTLRWQQQPGEPTLQADGLQAGLTLYPDTLNIHVQGQIIKPYTIQMNLAANGTPQQYHFSLQAFNAKTNWQIKGQVNPQQIQLDTEKALIFNGELTAHLTWRWTTPMSWQLHLLGRHLDFSSLQPNWPRPLDINVDSSGDLGKTQPHFSWNALITTPQSQITTRGQYNQQWDLNWDIRIRDLAEWLPFSSGKINSTGELHGKLYGQLKPQTKGTLQATLLHWKDYRIDKVNAAWDIDANETRHSTVQMTGEQLFARGLSLEKIQINGKGIWQRHEIDATLHGYNTDMQLRLTGGFDADHWQGAVQQLNITAVHGGEWSLSQAANLYLSAQRIEIPALCLHSTLQTQLCLRGKWSSIDDAWQLAVTSHLNLQQFTAFTPDALRINLPVDLHLTADGVGKTIQQAQLTGATAGGAIIFNGAENIETRINNGQLYAKLDKNGIAANLHIALPNNNTLAAELNLPATATTAAQSLKDQALHGQLTLALNDLTPIEAWIPNTVNPRGKLNAHFTVEGTLGEPLINGQAHLEGGEVKIPGLNIQLDHIHLTVNAKSSTLNYTLTANSANQPIQIVGQTELRAPQFPTQLTLTGENILFVDTPEYTAYVSPKIQLQLNGRDIHITGVIDIPKAVLRQLEFQQETTLPEDEVVYIGAHPGGRPTPWNITLKVTVNLGKDVKVASPGFKGTLGGSLDLLSEPRQVMLALGRIDITNGVYEIFGRQLTTTPGSGIIYRRNPLANPNLSVQATIRVEVTDALSQQQLGMNEITVGMNIGGTSSAPQVTLFSSAGNLSQADILSFLLLGTSSAGVSPTNMNLLLQALNTLPLTKRGASSAEGLTNQVKQSLGLSELGVESETSFGPTGEPLPTAAPTSYFVVGKRLTSRIYFRYKYDPFNSVNLFQLNYLFSKNWSLQLETDGSTQSGADILYTIQTGTAKSADKTSTGAKP